MANISEFRVGEKVHFGRTYGEKTLGEIIKVNRVKLKVRQLESRGTMRDYPPGTVWTVPVSLVSKTDASPSPTMPVEVQNRLRDAQDRDYAFLRGQEAPKPKRSEHELLKAIQGLYCQLSPENLHCDGEISRSAAARKGAALNRELRECFRELGRTVSECEAFGIGR